MSCNIFASGRTAFCVWNAVESILPRYQHKTAKDTRKDHLGYEGPKRILTYPWLFAPIALWLFIALVYPVSSSHAAQSPIDSSKSPETSFDISTVIEKAEHFIQKDLSNPAYYWVEGQEYRAEFTSEGVTYYQKQSGKRIDSNSLQFKLDFIKVSDQLVFPPRSASPVKVEENRLIYQRTPVIQEFYEAKREGIEQSWVIEQALSGKPEDLTIQGKLLTPLTAKSNMAGGIDLLDQAGRYVTTYGKVVVIDQTGKRLTISPVYDNGRLTITVPAEWLAAASYPVVVDPLIGANIQVDNLATADNYPAIAFDGTNYLIVWQTGTPNATGTGTTAIRGVRVSNSGTVLDGTPLSIGDTASRDDEFPSVAYDSVNSRYIVVWMMWNDTTAPVTAANVYRNTVTTAGGVGTSTAILTSTTRILAYPTVACCDLNNNYYVVYGRNSTTGATSFNAFWGQTYNRTTHAAATASNPTATVSSGTITPNTEPRSAPRLYSLSTTKYLLTWETFGVDANGDISANLLTATATPSYTWGTQVSIANTGAMLERYPRAAFDGANALIVYQQGATTSADIYSRFVTPGATNLTLGTTYTVSTVALSGQMYPDVAYTAGTCSATPISRYMVVWQDYRNNATNPDIYASPMNTAGTVETAVAISTDTTYIKERPVIAADSGSCGYMTAWSDNRNSGTTLADIYAQRVGYPNVNNLSPASGAVGAAISINGMNFGADPGAGNRSTATDNVKINGVQVSDTDVTSWSDGVISFAIPTGTTPGTYPVTVTAESWTSNGSNLTVNTNALQITTTSLPNGYQWITYGSNVSATGGTTPYSWTIISGALPAGVTLNSSSGLISGDPSSFGTFNFTVQVTDSTTPTPQTATQALSILIYELTAIAVTPANPTLTQGQTVQFTATGTFSDTSTSNISSIVAWGSANPGVATVNATGLATGVGLGAVTISATK